MKTYKTLSLMGLAMTSLFAAQAFAAPCPVAPVTGVQTYGGPVCIASVGQDGPGTGLVDILSLKSASNPNGIVTGGPNINPYTQQLTPSSIWSIGATGASENKLVLEIAGNANSNTFGIYDPTNSANSLQLFAGNASAGWSTQLSNQGNGKYVATYFDQGGIFAGQSTATFSVANQFGYYLGTTGGTFFSNPSMNAGGMAQMVAFAGNNQTKLQSAGVGGLFLSNEYLLAWEDQSFANSDLDYNDFLVLVESVYPVPEPTVLGMFGLGALLIGAAAGLRRRREDV